jgi:hypothetical protein
MQTLAWLSACVGGGGRWRDEVNAPTRSLYSPKFFENELQTSSSLPGRASSLRPTALFVDPHAETLVGEIDDRQQSAIVDDVRDPLPLFGRRIDAGRTVAAGVQADGVAGVESPPTPPSNHSKSSPWPAASM